MRLFFIIVSTFLLVSVHAQKKSSEHIPEVFDSTQFLYEFDIKYFGESIHVDPNYQYVIGYLVELMEKNPQWTLLVRGHVCCGPAMKISKKRACKAYKLLIELGVPKNRIAYEGYSDTKPLAFPEKTDEDAHVNRRVDFVITK
ncbi:MAG: OmpA family protein [Fluviicola sp.]|nr:OmpA family protein [Fluviicola sp.]